MFFSHLLYNMFLFQYIKSEKSLPFYYFKIGCILQLDHADLGFSGPIKYILEDKLYSPIIDAYKTLMFEFSQFVAEDLKMRLDTDQVKRDINNLFIFEQKIAHAYSADPDTPFLSKQFFEARMSIEELQNRSTYVIALLIIFHYRYDH